MLCTTLSVCNFIRWKSALVLNLCVARRSSPPVTAIRGLLAALRRLSQPYCGAAAAQWGRLYYDYHEFLSEETKRKWEWKRRTERERTFWDAAVTFVLGARDFRISIPKRA